MREIAAAFFLAIALAGCGAPAPIDARPVGAATKDATGIARHDLRFPCGDTMCAGWLYLPARAEASPVVVMANGFAGTRDVGLPYFAESFARAGIAAFVFDYRHFGASGGAPRQLVDPWQQLDDWKAALAFMRTSDRVDGTRVAFWGTSLGGGLALIAATRNEGVRAVVAQAPLVDTAMEGEATFPGAWWLTRLLLTAWRDVAGSLLGADPVFIAAIAPADSFGMMTDDAAFAAVKRIVPSQTLYRNQVAARSIFTFDDYNPAVQAASLKVPVLLIASRRDRFVPFAAVEAFAKTHANATVAEIEGDHFDVYVEPQAERAAALAATFLMQHLSTVK